MTALTGGYDKLKVHPQASGVDFWCFTDDASHATREDWQVRLLPPSNNPRLSAKSPKIIPHRFPELRGYDYTIWVDGNITLKDGFLACLDDLGPDGIALHKHPSRDCLCDEAAASLPTQKYDPVRLGAQVDHYRRAGIPKHSGLWACGMLARRSSTSLDTAMDVWYDEVVHWTVQDQVSFAFVVWSLDLKPLTWEFNIYGSPWVMVGPHGR